MKELIQSAKDAGMEPESFGMQTLEYATRIALDYAKPGAEFTSFFEGKVEDGKIVQLAVRIIDAPVSK